MRSKSAKQDLISLKKENVSINGKMMKIIRIVEPDVSVILPFADSKMDTLLIERQYRPALRKYVYELPAGHIDKGETPRQAAIREMQEETGFAPKHINFIFKAYPTPGSSPTMFYYFMSIGLATGNTKLHKDSDEVIKVKKVSLASTLKMIKSGRIKDNKTIAAILYYEKFLANR
ncbi:MAG: NUDIX hydrolase [Candidatus Micrarchaeia archaeon]